MALPSISTDDFTGTLRLSFDQFTAENNQAIIDERLPEILRCMIGQEAFAYVDATAILPNEWVKFFDGGSYTDQNDKEQYCYGFNQAVKYLLYFELLRDSNFVNTPTGNVMNLNENSAAQTQGNMSAVAINRYNSGIYKMQSVYDFVKDTAYFEENFPDMPMPKLELATI